jgi:hypothetical protein
MKQKEMVPYKYFGQVYVQPETVSGFYIKNLNTDITFIFFAVLSLQFTHKTSFI